MLVTLAGATLGERPEQADVVNYIHKLTTDCSLHATKFRSVRHLFVRREAGSGLANVLARGSSYPQVIRCRTPLARYASHLTPPWQLAFLRLLL